MKAIDAVHDPARADALVSAYARDPDRLRVLEQTGLLDAGWQTSLQRYARLAATLTASPMGFVTVIDADRAYAVGANGAEIQESPLERSYCQYVVADGVQLVIEDTRRDAVLAINPATTEHGIRAYLGSPVSAGGARLGAVCAVDTRVRPWTPEEQLIVEDLAAAVATDFELRLHLAREREMAFRDPLTGLGNRRALHAKLSDIFAAQLPVFMVLYYLNGFKSYNDAFGHPAGDALLVRLTGRLRQAAGEGGAFRMGGDEFCVVCTTKDELLLAQALLTERGPGFTVSSEVGIVEIPREATDASRAISLADERLYASKPGRPSALALV